MRTGSRCISGDGYARSGSLVLRRGKARAAPAAFACLAGTMRAGNRELRVSIKSDKWIRRMAVEGMIEPFEAGQVRHVNGEKIVSYGTSSYGYAVRCANEFKIFTNINSTIVEPKKFDEKSFVDVKSDVCIKIGRESCRERACQYV